MTDPKRRDDSDFGRTIGVKAKRKLAAQRHEHRTIWFGFGWFGLIGWSVAAPALLGTFLGLWLDHRYPSSYSWTLMLLLAGLMLGCWNAWHWIAQEEARINKKQDDDE
ncbi:MAG: AtpZ/AtpI family protein [Gammaproteobacteria bacterium]